VALSFWKKFFLHVCHQINLSSDSSSLMELHRFIPKGQQIYEERCDTTTVGKNLLHRSALKQTTGEAVYLDDMPKFANELYGVLVTSTEAHALIKYFLAFKIMRVEAWMPLKP
jgi:xanthine dehydrogenase/oxidase